MSIAYEIHDTRGALDALLESMDGDERISCETFLKKWAVKHDAILSDDVMKFVTDMGIHRPVDLMDMSHQISDVLEKIKDHQCALQDLLESMDDGEFMSCLAYVEQWRRENEPSTYCGAENCCGCDGTACRPC